MWGDKREKEKNNHRTPCISHMLTLKFNVSLWVANPRTVQCHYVKMPTLIDARALIFPPPPGDK